MKKNKELELAYEYVQYTNRNIFLTGKAGTGKTTFLRSLKERTQKRMVVVAPTGVAAINAAGVTIHSFFQLPFGPIISEKIAGRKINNPSFKQKFYKSKINIIKSLDLLIIDEISMVRADVLDAIDEILRRYKNRFLPFGGVQLLMIGDLQQLAPVVKNDEWALLREYYPSLFFFHSKALQEANLVSIELKTVYRQSDDYFLKILNEVRDDKLSKESYNQLHQRYIPDFSPDEKEGYITLTTHNNSANKINEARLKKIGGRIKKFKAVIDGKFSEHAYPTDQEIALKVGAQVMFVKNDSSPEKRYFNGKIGVVSHFEDDSIVVKCEGEEDIYTTPEKWENIKYSLNNKTQEIEEKTEGTFIQYPLRLAWAITIHKSQGLTFEKAIIDAAAAFAHGQTYVALSRCKTLEGMVLSTKISESAIICDTLVSDFNKQVEENQPDEEKLKSAKYAYQLNLIEELFSYKQLSYRIERLERILEDHKSSYQGNITPTISKIRKDILPEITSIARGFINQVQNISTENPDLEKNEHFQERIKKAASYFFKYHNDNIISILQNSSFESDNKVSKKAINEALNHINESLKIKQESLKDCINGFKLSSFIEVKAKAAINEKESIAKQSAKHHYKDIETKHPDLYSMLKFWRNEEATERNVPHYQIASQKMLQGIANTLPTSYSELISINGIGKVKASFYGDDIIEMVEEYILENGITKEKESEQKTIIKKPKKKKNWERSFELYKEGKSMEEIAKEQGFVISTIENHLFRFVLDGNIAIDELIEDNIVKEIRQCIKENPEADSLSEIKQLLPESISYGQIRMVRKLMETTETTPDKSQ